jgi:hypothetical protein
MIVDCCIFSNDRNLIETRLDLFGNTINKFIFFLESEIDSDFIQELTQYNLDVDFVIMDNFRNLQEIKSYIVSLGLAYEDIIIISEENEFIDLNQLEEIRERLIFSPVIISHKKFVDDGVLINYVRQKGSMIFFNHQIKFIDDILEKTMKEKFSENFRTTLPVESGFLA